METGVSRMTNRLLSATAVVVAAAAGCATQHSPPQHQTSQITVGDNTRAVNTVSCMQIGSLLKIDTTAEPAHVRAILQLEGAKPTLKTLSIEDFDGFYGVAGEGIGNADATFADGAYTITGTARGSNSNTEPGQSKTTDFRIEARC